MHKTVISRLWNKVDVNFLGEILTDQELAVEEEHDNTVF
jgi:hypothetical protein